MSRTSIIAILACAGVVFTGEVTADAMAFARVVQTGDGVLLLRFAQQNPGSKFAPVATEIAVKCTPNWIGGACGPLEFNNNHGALSAPLTYGKSG